MLYSLLRKVKKIPQLGDLAIALLFGVLSLLLGELKFVIPGIEGSQQVDFREIPLIISVFYLRNPLYIFILCLITILVFPFEGSYLAAYIMHAIPLLITWVFFKKLDSITDKILSKGIIWFFFVLLYYTVLLIPIWIFIDQLVGLNTVGFLKTYILIVNSATIEIIPTAIITGLYLVQFETRANLESLILNRTTELAAANKKLKLVNEGLITGNEEIKSMNENLDGLVKERSKVIKEQLDLFRRYAHMNSHEVRAPLARILGLMEIVKLDPKLLNDSNIVVDLCKCGNELDEVVKNMNRLLESEIDSEEFF